MPFNQESLYGEVLPQVMTLNPSELISWCKLRKEAMHLSNAMLADITNVPVGTIDRILSGNYTEFRYSSIQPLLSVLIGYDQETPPPENTESAQAQDYYEQIEGYKLVVENKNHVIDQLKKSYEQLVKEISFLKVDNDHKQNTINSQLEHIKWLEKLVDEVKRL
ncbi:MAG: hypothetical protein KBS63_03565 [Clostridiales bacterium]|nr:hypothetical protein [Candidatus Crickella caballi]